jgi:hypothetical protein
VLSWKVNYHINKLLVYLITYLLTYCLRAPKKIGKLDEKINLGDLMRISSFERGTKLGINLLGVTINVKENARQANFIEATFRLLYLTFTVEL